jgi:hypothetical protein
MMFFPSQSNAEETSDPDSVINDWGYPSGELFRGDELEAWIQVRNPYNYPFVFHLGCSLLDPEGRWIDLPERPVALFPNETSNEILFKWTIPDDAVPGYYGIKCAIWNRTVGDSLANETAYIKEDRAILISVAPITISPAFAAISVTVVFLNIVTWFVINRAEPLLHQIAFSSISAIVFGISIQYSDVNSIMLTLSSIVSFGIAIAYISIIPLEEKKTLHDKRFLQLIKYQQLFAFQFSVMIYYFWFPLLVQDYLEVLTYHYLIILIILLLLVNSMDIFKWARGRRSDKDPGSRPKETTPEDEGSLTIADNYRCHVCGRPNKCIEHNFIYRRWYDKTRERRKKGP